MNLDPEKEGVLNNVETCWFRLTIEDIERRSKRLEQRNDDLNNDITFTNTLLEENDSETRAKIEKLKKELGSTTATLDNIASKVNGLEKDIKDADAANARKFAELEAKFNLKRKELLSELKYYEAKINYLNDFKKMQTALQDKYLKNNELMVMREANFQVAMEELDGKRRSDRDNLKQDGKKLLYRLSSEFHSEVDRTVEKPAKRMLRETVVLKPFFQSVLFTIDKLKIPQDTRAEKDECRQLSLTNCRLIAASILEKTLLNYIRRLKTRTQDNEWKPCPIVDEASSKFQKYNDFNATLKAEVATLKVELYKHEIKTNVLKQAAGEVAGKYTRVVGELYKIKYNVYDVLKCLCDCQFAVEKCVNEINRLV